MKIDLSKLYGQIDKVFNFDGKIERDFSNISTKEFKILEHIEYNGIIYQVGNSYMIDINIEYEYKTRCDRCLQETTKKMKTSLMGKLTNYEEIDQDSYNDDFNEDENGDDLIFYKNDILDVEEYVIMEVSSSLPMKTLCSEECKGICPQCGINLNTEECDCITEDIEPRFEKLKDLFKD